MQYARTYVRTYVRTPYAQTNSLLNTLVWGSLVGPPYYGRRPDQDQNSGDRLPQIGLWFMDLILLTGRIGQTLAHPSHLWPRCWLPYCILSKAGGWDVVSRARLNCRRLRGKSIVWSTAYRV